jgi:S-adenosylmethionine decarboxylase
MRKRLVRAREVPPELIVTGGECEPRSAANVKTTRKVIRLRPALETAQQGLEVEAETKAQVKAAIEPQEEPKDHFVTREGLTYAGQHLIVDLWDGQGFDDKDFIEQTFRQAVEASKATLLHIHLHAFSGGGGVSGVAVLAESHISIHTWPERGYAAIDIFMCGIAEPMKAVEVMRRAFKPRHASVSEHKRGIV